MQTTTSPKRFPLGAFIKWVIVGLLLIGTGLAYYFHEQIFGEASVFNRDIFSNAILNAVFQKIPALIRSVQIITIAYIISAIVRGLLKLILARTKRGATIVTLVNSFIKYAVAIIALLMALNAWGVDTGTLLASAGLLGLVIGLGAESLIADIIAGVFMVFEGEYQVGDIIVVDGWRGTVEEIGIRTTRIVDTGGNKKIINNNDMRSIINQTQDLSLAKCIVGVEYGDSLERIEVVIRDNLEKIGKNIPAIADGPYYKGVDALNSSSVDLLFVAKCKEEDIFQVQRDLNREIKLVFDKNGINIPFPQVTYSALKENDVTVSKYIEKASREFNEEQRALSKGLEDEDK